MVRWIQIKTNDVANFFDEEGVVEQFEVTLSVRLHAEQVELTLRGGFGNAGVLGHAGHTPLRRIGLLGFKGGVDHLGHALVLMDSGLLGA